LKRFKSRRWPKRRTPRGGGLSVYNFISIPACFADVATFSGVITKTDALQGGDKNIRARWGRIFTGEEEAHRFRHGYFAVRLADDNQRMAGVSREEMKQISDAFFALTAPWRDMDPPYKERQGITNLTEHLSKLLIELIEARFVIHFFLSLQKLLMNPFLFPFQPSQTTSNRRQALESVPRRAVQSATSIRR
jgi:hypothetical protein